MSFRCKRRFIRTVIELADGRSIIRKSWTYGHTHRALRNAHNALMAQYPDWQHIESRWENADADDVSAQEANARR